MKRFMQATWQGVVACFLAGVFALLPLVITVAVIAWVANFLAAIIGPDAILGRGIRELGLHFASDGTLAYIFGALIVLAAVFVVGVFVQAGAKSLLRGVTQALVRRIPLVGSIYGTSQQLVGMLDKKDQTDVKGMGVVFCLFGKEGGAGFLALLVSPERFRINGRDYQIVIVPTAPVPVGGGLLFVPAEAVQRVDVSVDGLMSIYVSMGISAPQFLPKATGEKP